MLAPGGPALWGLVTGPRLPVGRGAPVVRRTSPCLGGLRGMGDAMEGACPKIVICEGNISAGKSTLCAAMAREFQWPLFLEATGTCTPSPYPFPPPL